jgi:hypothetical protein
VSVKLDTSFSIAPAGKNLGARNAAEVTENAVTIYGGVGEERQNRPHSAYFQPQEERYRSQQESDHERGERTPQSEVSRQANKVSEEPTKQSLRHPPLQVRKSSEKKWKSYREGKYPSGQLFATQMPLRGEPDSTTELKPSGTSEEEIIPYEIPKSLDRGKQSSL